MKTYHDIVGDGGSDVIGQVEALQASIDAALSGVDRLLAIGSGKGGVGKSTVTMALAQALRRRGRDVAVVDCDFNGPCQARLAGLEATPWLPGEHGLALPRRADGIGVLSLGSVLAPGAVTEFDSVAAGEEQTWRATKELAALRQLLAGVAWGELDALLFDLPPGAERTVQLAQLLGPRTAFVLVTVPSDVARGVVARSLTALDRVGSPVLGYVENMAGYYCRDCDAVRPLFPASTIELAAPCLGEVPFDQELAELCDRGWPAGSDEPRTWRTIEAVAERIEQSLENRA